MLLAGSGKKKLPVTSITCGNSYKWIKPDKFIWGSVLFSTERSIELNSFCCTWAQPTPVSLYY